MIYTENYDFTFIQRNHDFTLKIMILYREIMTFEHEK